MKSYVYTRWLTWSTGPGEGPPRFDLGVLLLKETYSLNTNTHEFVSDLAVNSNECTVTGYARVTKDPTHSVDRTGNVSLVKMSNTWTFPAFTATGAGAPRYVVFFYEPFSDMTDEQRRLVCVWDLEAPTDVTDEQVVIDADEVNGFMRVVSSPAAVTP